METRTIFFTIYIQNSLIVSLIYGLFDDAVSISDCVMKKVTISEFEEDVEEMGHDLISTLS
jgi:hypothetical protein